MGLDLAKMRAKAEAEKRSKEKKTSENDAFFWKPPTPSGDEKQTKTKVRIILPPDGDPLRKLWLHYGLKGSGGILCLKKNYGEKCPICDFASKLWKDRKHDKDEIASAAKKLFAKERFYTPVVVRGQEDKGIRWFNLNQTNHNRVLYDYMLDEDFQEGVTDDITDPQKGVDLIVKRERPGNGNTYDTISVDVNPAGKSPLAPAKEVAKLMETFRPIDDLMKRKTLEEVQAALDLHINGSTEQELGGNDGSGDDSSDDQDDSPGMDLAALGKEITGD